tara:strand:+ start:61504 stop:61686 length:183 start_codon:yes stop_codon:yes gene_type:complete
VTKPPFYRCKYCANFAEHYKIPGKGECRAHPPVRLADGIFGWPDVNDGAWCGAFDKGAAE